MSSNRPEINNRNARYNYFVEKKLECGIVLLGSEVKSISDGQCNLKDSWIDIVGNELILKNCHISCFTQANTFEKLDPVRDRKLLAHKREIINFKREVDQAGYTLVPLRIYYTGHNYKVEVGLCKGKKSYDKRASIKEREISRKIKEY